MCLPQKPKRREVRAKTHVSLQDHRLWLGDWPESTEDRRGQSWWYAGLPVWEKRRSSRETDETLKANNAADEELLEHWKMLSKVSVHTARQWSSTFQPLSRDHIIIIIIIIYFLCRASATGGTAAGQGHASSTPDTHGSSATAFPEFPAISMRHSSGENVAISISSKVYSGARFSKLLKKILKGS